MTWIKICGTTNLDDALASIAAGADALGFIFTESPRRITPEAAAEIIAALPEAIEKIGVVVHETPETLAKLANEIRLTGIQLHGDEPADQLSEFRRALNGRKLIKTLQVRELLGDPQKLDGYLQARENVDAVLLDSGSAAARGGTGVPFDWKRRLSYRAANKGDTPVDHRRRAEPGQCRRSHSPVRVRGESRSLPALRSCTGKKDDAKLRAFVAAARAVSAMRGQ